MATTAKGRPAAKGTQTTGWALSDAQAGGRQGGAHICTNSWCHTLHALATTVALTTVALLQAAPASNCAATTPLAHLNAAQCRRGPGPAAAQTLEADSSSAAAAGAGWSRPAGAACVQVHAKEHSEAQAADPTAMTARTHSHSARTTLRPASPSQIAANAAKAVLRSCAAETCSPLAERGKALLRLVHRAVVLQAAERVGEVIGHEAQLGRGKQPCGACRIGGTGSGVQCSKLTIGQVGTSVLPALQTNG